MKNDGNIAEEAIFLKSSGAVAVAGIAMGGIAVTGREGSRSVDTGFIAKPERSKP